MVFVMVRLHVGLDFGDLDDVVGLIGFAFWYYLRNSTRSHAPQIREEMKINMAQKPSINTAVTVTTYMFSSSAPSSRGSATWNAFVYSC
jgi:hypothetical protein